jgi:hypothetical protein
VKIFVKELPDKVELNHLVTDDKKGDPTETEVEWTLQQAGPAQGELDDGGPLADANNQSVIRRYEFYKPDYAHQTRAGGRLI